MRDLYEYEKKLIDAQALVAVRLRGMGHSCTDELANANSYTGFAGQNAHAGLGFSNGAAFDFRRTTNQLDDIAPAILADELFAHFISVFGDK